MSGLWHLEFWQLSGPLSRTVYCT